MKKCLIINSEPYYWDEFFDVIKTNGITPVIVKSVKEAVEKLSNEIFSFAMVSNTLYGPIPFENGVNPVISPKYDKYSVGSIYASKYLEEKNLPYMIVFTTRPVTNEKQLKNCFLAIDLLKLTLGLFETKLREKGFIV